MAVFKRFKKKLTNLSYSVLIFINIFVCLLLLNIKIAINHSQKPVLPKNLTKSKSSQKQVKNMLLWTSPRTTPFSYFGTGNSVFLNRKCKWNNCYVTNNRNYLGDYTEFDVIAFHGPELLERLAFGDIPERRLTSQKYVYANIEASSNYPLCTDVWDGFFNWTWTYKLNSDAVWSYFAVRNASNHVIGPNENMNWLHLEQMDDIDQDLKQKLKSKRKTAAWYSSNCVTQSLRENYVEELRGHLQKFGMDVNVYGKCGQFGCPTEIMPQCLNTLEKHYYFYLAFENAISEDYVTEKILNALNHNTVPIVFGGANYSRFMPDGTYLNAFNMKPKELAARMKEIINNSTEYYKFFRWKKYYSFHQKHLSPDTDDYCKFCAIMNNDQLMKKTTVYENLNEWWTGLDMNNVCHPTMHTVKNVMPEA